jgi:hypothetical protein
MALTGLISHWAYQPGLPGNATVNPALDIPVLLRFPTSWPSWDFAINQGVHVVLGLMLLPLLLAKLWSVIPKLFARPLARSVAGTIERASMVLLVSSVLVEFATGIAEVDGWSLPINWHVIHYYGAWVFTATFVLHACLKMPTVRRSYRERGVLKPLRENLAETKPEPADGSGLVAVHPDAPTLTRRGLLAIVGGASLTILAMQIGTSTGGALRRLALLAPRGRVLGTGPNGFPVTMTAEGAQITEEMVSENWRLVLTGSRIMSLTREQLLAMPQTSHELTLTCTEGWSTTQTWTGVRLADLGGLAGAPEGAILRAASMQSTYNPAGFTHAQFSDERALLALRVNGVDLSADHGYPARVILPGVPGVHNTKWVRELTFEAA